MIKGEIKFGRPYIVPNSAGQEEEVTAEKPGQVGLRLPEDSFVAVGFSDRKSSGGYRWDAVSVPWFLLNASEIESAPVKRKSKASSRDYVVAPFADWGNEVIRDGFRAGEAVLVPAQPRRQVNPIPLGQIQRVNEPAPPPPPAVPFMPRRWDEDINAVYRFADPEPVAHWANVRFEPPPADPIAFMPAAAVVREQQPINGGLMERLRQVMDAPDFAGFRGRGAQIMAQPEPPVQPIVVEPAIIAAEPIAIERQPEQIRPAALRDDGPRGFYFDDNLHYDWQWDN